MCGFFEPNPVLLPILFILFLVPFELDDHVYILSRYYLELNESGMECGCCGELRQHLLSFVLELLDFFSLARANRQF